MNYKIYPSILIAASVSLSQAFSQDQLAVYDFTGGSFASQDVELNTIAGALDASSIGTSALESPGFGNPFDNPSLVFIGNEYNDGFGVNNDYLSFTVTPGAGFQITFDQLSLGHYNTTNAGATAYIFSSIDGFASTSDSVGSFFFPDGNGGSPDPDNTGEISLTGLTGFSNVITATEFRVYLDTTASFGTGDTYTDNIILTGTVSAVPEPSTYALLSGMIVLGWVMVRRR